MCSFRSPRLGVATCLRSTRSSGGPAPRSVHAARARLAVPWSGAGTIACVSIEPDTKDWTWVLDRACPECGFDPAPSTATTLADLIHENTRGWYAAARRTPTPPYGRPRTCGRRLEYACHVRDVHRLFAERVQLMLDEDDPDFDNWDQDATAVEERLRPAGPGRRSGPSSSSEPPRRPRSTPRSRATSGSGRPAKAAATARSFTVETHRPLPPARRRPPPLGRDHHPGRAPARTVRTVRHTEFWARMEQALGPAYARSWAEQHVLRELDGRTVVEAAGRGRAAEGGLARGVGRARAAGARPLSGHPGRRTSPPFGVGSSPKRDVLGVPQPRRRTSLPGSDSEDLGSIHAHAQATPDRRSRSRGLCPAHRQHLDSHRPGANGAPTRARSTLRSTRTSPARSRQAHHPSSQMPIQLLSFNDFHGNLEPPSGSSGRNIVDHKLGPTP